MIPNESEIEVTPKKKRHPGFWDCEGQELNPGDMIAVCPCAQSIVTAIITRFTPRRVYYKLVFVPPWYARNGRTEFNEEWCNQPPNDSSDGRIQTVPGVPKGQIMTSILKIG